jgi:hypothetical protein
MGFQLSYLVVANPVLGKEECFIDNLDPILRVCFLITTLLAIDSIFM